MPNPTPPATAASAPTGATGEPPPAEREPSSRTAPRFGSLLISGVALALGATVWFGDADEWAPLMVLVAALIFGSLFSCLSASLLRTLPSMLESGRHGPSTLDELKRHLGDDLERAERLAASSSMAAFVCRAAAIVALYIALGRWLQWDGIALAALTTAIGGPTLHLITQSIPLAFAQARSEVLLADMLPLLAAILRPFGWITTLLTVARRALLRMTRTPDSDYGTRRLVEGFRALVEEADLHGDLAAGTQEMIANVIEFSGADAAEVMTPRTEVSAIAMDQPLERAIEVFATSGYSRIPVFRDSIDTIVGTLTALEAAKAVADKRLASTKIVDVMRPPLLVPETKLVPELLTDFRQQRQKMAIVVDEYGGTAGLVTLADVMAEILGDVQDEFTGDEQRIVDLGDGRLDVDAGLHVSEINDEMDLDLPEESDYETLAGFVLSEFGRFPHTGEALEHEGHRFIVTEANDRRVLRVTIQRTATAIRRGPETGHAPGLGQPHASTERARKAIGEKKEPSQREAGRVDPPATRNLSRMDESA